MIYILNLDNSVAGQPALLARHNPVIIDALDLGPRVRLWMSRREKEFLAQRLPAHNRKQLFFLGSGDFHHLSLLFTEKINTPFCLIVFDLHPDWDIFPPRFGCGSWVSAALKNSNLQKAVLLWQSSDDLSTGALQSGNLSALKNGRLEIYPYQHRPSFVFARNVPASACLKVKRWPGVSKISWEGLRQKNLGEFLTALILRLPSKKVYLSIDKYCLKKEYAATNWEEGGFVLEGLLLMLKAIKENCEIIGADVTGEYSPPRFSNRLKAFFARLDHPKENSSHGLSAQEIHARNQETNLKILEALY